MIGIHFTGIILAQGKARFAPQCPTLQAKRNAAFGQKNPASGGMKPAIGYVPLLARCKASRRATRLPEWPV